MAEYYINNTPLSQFGIMPAQADGNIAVAGCFNLPKRTGIISFDWPRSHSVEPYVEPGDITFGSRDITITGIITAGAAAHLQAWNEFAASLPELFPFSCKWAGGQVKYAGMDVQTVGRDCAQVVIKLTEPVPVLGGVLPAGGQIKEIDDYSWQMFGLWVSDISGCGSAGAPKRLRVTQNTSSSLVSAGGNDKTEITVAGVLRAPDPARFKSNISSLYALFGGPGLRTLRCRGREIICFCADGFTVSEVVSAGHVCAKFNCKLIVVSNEII